MDLRKMKLPEGWYPRAGDEAEARLTEWEGTGAETPAAIAAVVPHAGWAFSGKTAWKIIRQIPEDTELIIIAGGHLQAGSVPLLMDYKDLETPFGLLHTDRDAAAELCSSFDSDISADNTVEVQLPMVKFHLPDISVLPVRLPPDVSSTAWAAKAAEALKGRKVFFLGSTDLSHYGLRFAYSDYGFGSSARDRIREIDYEFLQALKNGEALKALDLSERKKCACSAGAAAAASVFAQANGATGRIIDQRYSYQVFDDGGDFVGYGSVLYCN